MQTRKFAGDIAIGERHTYDGLQPIYGPIPNASGKVLAAPRRRLGTENLVIVTLGQSNAANFSAGSYQAGPEVVNFSLYDGNCYRAADPLIGASGDTGNFATRLGDILIGGGLAERIVLAPIAMGNTGIEDWALGGVFHTRILVLIRRLFDAGLSPDLILWQQGEGNEADADPGGRRYRGNLVDIVETFRTYGITAPFLVALCTLCGEPHPNAANVRAGQLGAIDPDLGTFQGPDTDKIGPADRFDGCHMSEAGACKQALMWAEAIAAVRR
jgi:Carbohydrate esterase, sialic acid-specific acetylesterase